jgi:hypothetical protein
MQCTGVAYTACNMLFARGLDDDSNSLGLDDRVDDRGSCQGCTQMELWVEMLQQARCNRMVVVFECLSEVHESSTHACQFSQQLMLASILMWNAASWCWF